MLQIILVLMIILLRLLLVLRVHPAGRSERTNWYWLAVQQTIEGVDIVAIAGGSRRRRRRLVTVIAVAVGR